MADQYSEEFDRISDEDEVGDDKPKPLVLSPSTMTAPAGGKLPPTPVPLPVASPVGVNAVPLPTKATGSPATVPPSGEEERVVQAVLDSGMWKRQFDEKSNRFYYFHTVTKATTWDLAKELGITKKVAPLHAVSGPPSSVTGSNSPSIRSPNEQTITLKLPARFRKTGFGSEPSAEPSADRSALGSTTSDPPSSTLVAAPDRAANEHAAEFQKLTRYQAFGSVTAASDAPILPQSEGLGARQDDADEVKRGSGSLSPLDDEVPSARIDSARRASQAREAFKAFARASSDASASPTNSSTVPDPVNAAKFQTFGTFRAFGSEDRSQDRPAPIEITQTDDKNGTGARAPTVPVADTPRDLAAAGRPPAATLPRGAAGSHPTGEGDNGHANTDSSSVFSTASQNLAKAAPRVSPTSVIPSVDGGGREGANGAAPRELDATKVGPQAATGRAATPQFPLSSGPSAAEDRGQAQTPLAVVSPTLQLKPYVVPSKQALPNGGDEPKRDFESGTRLVSPASAFAAGAAPNTSTSLLQFPVSTASVAGASNARLLEIRETTDAVERLVRAFTHLRGLEAVGPSSREKHEAVLRASSASGLHGVRTQEPIWGAGIRELSVRKSLEDQVAAARRAIAGRADGTGNAAAVDDGTLREQLLDNVLVDCVLEMMVADHTNHLARSLGRRSSPAGRSSPPPTPQRGAMETVTIQQHRRFTTVPQDRGLGTRSAVRGGLPAETRFNPFSVFGEPHEAFAQPWRSANDGNPRRSDDEAPLGSLIDEALNKYVLRHLVLRTVHPPLVRLMMLDLMATLIQASLTCFDGGELGGAGGVPSAAIPDTTLPSSSPVLVRFDGPERDCSFASQLCHSLPLEVMPPAPDAGGMDAGSAAAKLRPPRLYRLEYWVTRGHLWVVVAALQRALRRAEAIESDGYRPFRTPPTTAPANVKATPQPQKRGGTSVKPGKQSASVTFADGNVGSGEDAVFIPQELPLFSLVSSSARRGDGSGAASPEVLQSPPPPAANVVTRNVEWALLEPIRLAATARAGLLVSNPAFDTQLEHMITTQDTMECAVETIQELLSDADIVKAVERRASQKLLARALKRKDSKPASTAQQELEKAKREEQLRIVQEAEEKAARMVDEIRAELAASASTAKKGAPSRR